MADFTAVNAVYARVLGDARPARSTVAVYGLPRDVRVERNDELGRLHASPDAEVDRVGRTDRRRVVVGAQVIEVAQKKRPVGPRLMGGHCIYVDDDDVSGDTALAAPVPLAIEALEGRGVPVQVDHILGLPGEPDDAQDRARVFYARHAPTRISIYWATYFPGTEIIQQGLAAGRLTPADVDAIEDGDLAAYHDSAAASGGDEAAALLRGHDLVFRLFPWLPRALRTRVDPAVPDTAELVARGLVPR